MLPDPTNVTLDHDFTRVRLILYGQVEEGEDVRRAECGHKVNEPALPQIQRVMPSSSWAEVSAGSSDTRVSAWV